jgi:hypothetical protein
LLGEAFMWVMAVAVASFDVSLNLTIFWIALGSAFVVYGISYRIIRKGGGNGIRVSGTKSPPFGEESGGDES